MAIMPLLGIPFRYNSNLPARYGPYGPPPANPYAVAASSQLGPFAQGGIPQPMGPIAQGPVGWTDAPMAAIGGGGASSGAFNGAGGVGAPIGALGPASAVQQAAQQVGGQTPGAASADAFTDLVTGGAGGGGAAAEAAAQAAPAAGRLGGILSRIEGALPFDVAPGSLGPAAMYAAGGQLAGGLANKALGGSNPLAPSPIGGKGTRPAITGALEGGGLGMAAAALAPETFGLSALLPLAGALGGGALGMFGHKDTGRDAVNQEVAAQAQKLSGTLSAAGVPTGLQQNALMQLQLGAQGAKSRDEVRQLTQQLTASLGPQLAQQKYQMAMAGAVQSWLGPMMQQQLNQQQFYANQEGSAMRDIASQMPDAGSRATAQALAAQVPANAAQSAAGQLLTMANSPYALGAGGYQQAVQQAPAR